MTVKILPDRENLGWTPYAWLVYLVPFAAYPFLDRARPSSPPKPGASPTP